MAGFITPDSDIEFIARQLMGTVEDFGFLADAKIEYLFRTGKWSSKNRETWGETYKVPDIHKELHGRDFIIVVSHGVWRKIERHQKKALMHHLLSHCHMSDSGGWGIAPHDFGDFNRTIREYGSYNEDISRLLRSYEEGQEEKIEQLSLAIDGMTEAKQGGDPEQIRAAEVRFSMAYNYAPPEIREKFHMALKERVPVVTAVVKNDHAESGQNQGDPENVDPKSVNDPAESVSENLESVSEPGHTDHNPAPAVDNVRPIRPGAGPDLAGQAAAGQVVF